MLGSAGLVAPGEAAGDLDDAEDRALRRRRRYGRKKPRAPVRRDGADGLPRAAPWREL